MEHPFGYSSWDLAVFSGCRKEENASFYFVGIWHLIKSYTNHILRSLCPSLPSRFRSAQPAQPLACADFCQNKSFVKKYGFFWWFPREVAPHGKRNGALWALSFKKMIKMCPWGERRVPNRMKSSMWCEEERIFNENKGIQRISSIWRSNDRWGTHLSLDCFDQPYFWPVSPAVAGWFILNRDIIQSEWNLPVRPIIPPQTLQSNPTFEVFEPPILKQHK